MMQTAGHARPGYVCRILIHACAKKRSSSRCFHNSQPGKQAPNLSVLSRRTRFTKTRATVRIIVRTSTAKNFHLLGFPCSYEHLECVFTTCWPIRSALQIAELSLRETVGCPHRPPETNRCDPLPPYYAERPQKHLASLSSAIDGLRGRSALQSLF